MRKSIGNGLNNRHRPGRDNEVRQRHLVAGRDRRWQWTARRGLMLLAIYCMPGGMAVATEPSAAESSRGAITVPSAAQADLLACVAPAYKESVARCLRRPTVAARAQGEPVVCTKAVYDWLLDHPDRVALAWQRRNIPCLPIQARADGSFGWADDWGSEVIWRTVGRFRDGRIWYARGSVKPAQLAPPIPVEGVVIFHYPIVAEQDGVARYAPRIECYLHSDSRAAHVALKILGPSVSELADQAAAQLIEFFSGIAAYVQNHPDRASQLLAPAAR